MFVRYLTNKYRNSEIYNDLACDLQRYKSRGRRGRNKEVVRI